MTERDRARAPQQPPEPDPELRRLDPFVGACNVEGETSPRPAGPALKVTGPETFEWLYGGFFLVHRWETVFGEVGEAAASTATGGIATGVVQKGIQLLGYDAATGKYRTHFFDANGPYDPTGSTYEGELVDGQLVFTGPARFRYELDADGTIKVSGDGTLEKQWELRDADGTWSPWMHNTYTRVTPAGVFA